MALLKVSFFNIFYSCYDWFFSLEPDTVNTLLAKLIVQLKKEKNVIKTENAKYLICPLDGDDRQPFFTEKIQLEDSYV